MSDVDDSRQHLERLYCQHGAAIWAYLLRRVPDRHTAEELFQEVFLVAARNPAAVDAAESKRAWLVGIARNLLRESRRRRQRDDRLQEAAAIRIDREDRHPEVDSMREAVNKLPAPMREALELRLTQDLTYAEIAKVLNVPIGTVRSRIHNAVRRLRTWARESQAATE